MLEEGVSNMDKKSSRQSSAPPKNGSSCDSKKNDNNSPNRFAKHGKKRESAGARGGTPDYARRPAPQKSRTTVDKRPRPRGNFNDRQREEVAGKDDPDYGSPLFTGGSKKANLNHLLNFTFAGREPERGNVGNSRAPYRGSRKPKTSTRVYNKERFLQANCQFVVGEDGDYTAHSIDADTLVDWDLVEQVRTLSNEAPTCPICLQEPQAGKITRCGHIYCWACILHYLELGEKKWRKCPICYDYVQKTDLKSVQIRVVHAYQPGEKITLRLMKRERGSTYSVPSNQWQEREGKPHQISDDVNTEYTKLLVASLSQIQDTIMEPEKTALHKHMDTAEASEVCFIESAMVNLKDREQSLKNRNIKKRVEAAKKPVATSPEDVRPKEIVKDKMAEKTKSYTSAFSDNEDSDTDDKAAELLPESPIPEIDPMTSDPDLQSPDLEPHPDSPSSPTSLHSDSDISGSRLSTSSEIDTSLDANGNTPEGIVRERSSLSESSVGSAEGPCPIQQSMNDALPVDEAAEHLELPSEPSHKSTKAKSAFYYYQASDGQHIYLHSVNARCLVKEYGSLEDAPDFITATIIDTERIFMTDELRKRLRYLSHLPLTCEFQVAELALKPPVLSKQTLAIFAGDLEKRRRMRQRKTREEKKRSKKIEQVENEKMGIFPEMQISLSSSLQFPSCDLGSYNYTQSLHVSPEVRCDSPSISSLASTPPISPSDVGELGAVGRDSDGEQTWSFAQMLKAGKTKSQPLWPKPASASEMCVVGARVKSADSEDSDAEDRVPVPMFQDSFSHAIQAALDTATKDKESRPSGGGKKKKQKQKFTKLFDTSMTRGK